MKITAGILALILPLPGLAQTTCYTDPQGKTLCSTPGGVVQGTTSSIGSSIYRDDRGNLLKFQTDWSGKASVQPQSGEPINWSQGVLGEKKYPLTDNVPPKPARVVQPNPAETGPEPLLIAPPGQP